MKITISSLATLGVFALMTNAAPIDDSSEVANLEPRQAFSWLTSMWITIHDESFFMLNLNHFTVYDDVGYKGKSMGIYSISNNECSTSNLPAISQSGRRCRHENG